MKKTSIIALLFVLFCAVLGTYSQRHAISCEAVAFTNYQHIATNVYASPDVANSAEILEVIRLGRERVNATFGTMNARPKIVVVASEEEADGFGANGTATAFYTPLGTCIVLAPQGHNIDVAAHELTHAEIGDRIGWYTYMTQIPLWFNEGMALMVDHRQPFLIENIALEEQVIRDVRQLQTARQFFSQGNVFEHYQASRVAVDQIPPQQLYVILALIKQGVSFEDALQRYEVNAN